MLTESQQQPQNIGNFTPDQVQNMFAQHMLWVDSIYEMEDEGITELSPVTRPYLISSVEKGGEVIETRSAFNPEQRECIYALIGDINVAIGDDNSGNKLLNFVRATFPQKREYAAAVTGNLIDLEEFEGLVELNKTRYKREDLYYSLKILEKIYEDTLQINPAYEHVWKSLVHFDVMGMFIMLSSMSESIHQIAKTGSGSTSYDVGFNEEYMGTHNGVELHLQSRCPFRGFVLRTGALLNSYTP